MVMCDINNMKCNGAMEVLLKSDNLYYIFGLSLLINEINSMLSKSPLYFLVGESSSDSNEKKIIFRDTMVSVHLNKKSRSWKNDNTPPCKAIYHIPFGCRQNNLSEIMCKLEKILLIAHMDYSSFIRPENHKSIGLQDFRQLSLTECKVLLLIGKGYNIGRISKILNRSEKTINTHYRNTIRKLGVINRVEFYKYASLIAHGANKDCNTLCL